MEFENNDDELIYNKENNDPIVVSASVIGFKVKRILVDSGNVMEVLSWGAYKRMGLKEQF